MKQKPGFNAQNDKPEREETPYDFYLEKFVRVDVAGGIGGTGVLTESKRLEHGYIFSLNPAVLYEKLIPTIIKDPVLINSNGNPVSFYPMPKSIEDFVKDNQPEQDSPKIIVYSR